MKACPYCAEAIPEDAQFCQFCGTSLAGPVGGTATTGPGAIPPDEVRTSGKAIASFICGLFSFLFPSAIVAIILGHLSLTEIKNGFGRVRGKGMALTGLILGYLGISILPILIIAAIAIPNLLRARMAANEASAVGSLRSYSYALAFYAAKCPMIGFPNSLESLGPGRGDCHQANLLDHSLGVEQPVKSGYQFHYEIARPDRVGQVTSFAVRADPITQGTTGYRHFYVDQTGIVRWSSDGPADAGSPPLQ